MAAVDHRSSKRRCGWNADEKTHYYNEKGEYVPFVCWQPLENILPGGLCIFHSEEYLRDPNNKQNIIEKLAEKIEEPGPLICIGYRLPDISFVGRRFDNPVDFSRAQFTGEANFFGAEFTGGAYFGGAVFTGGAGFSRAQFTGEANFFGAEFTGEAISVQNVEEE